MGTNKQKQWYTVTEAAKIAGYTPSYVRRMLRSGIVLGEKLGPRTWLLPAKSIAFLEAIPESPTGRPKSGKKI